LAEYLFGFTSMNDELKGIRLLATVAVLVQAALMTWGVLASGVFLTGAQDFIRSQHPGSPLPGWTASLFGVLEHFPKTDGGVCLFLGIVFVCVSAAGIAVVRSSASAVTLVARIGVFSILCFSFLVAWLFYILVCVATPFIML